MRVNLMLVAGCILVFAAAGCQLSRDVVSSERRGTQFSEPDWVREGDPIPFLGEDWYPTDEVESLLDPEVYQAGVYKDVPFYLEKADVKPFARLYTYFSKNRYRVFERRE